MNSLRRLEGWIEVAETTVREVGQLFKSVRLKSQMSQEEFAAEIGISIVHLSRIENGLAIPSVGVMMQLRDYMREAPWWT